jgi:hypothetical protein
MPLVVAFPVLFFHGLTNNSMLDRKKQQSQEIKKRKERKRRAILKEMNKIKVNAHTISKPKSSRLETDKSYMHMGVNLCRKLEINYDRNVDKLEINTCSQSSRQLFK